MADGPRHIIAAAGRRDALADSPYLATAGRAAMPLPLPNLIAPVADLLRTGVDRARDRIETMLIHRAVAIRERSTSSHPAFDLRTPHGDLRIQCHAPSMEASIRLDMGAAYILGRELVLRDMTLPGTVCAALAGEPVASVADVPILPRDVRIRQARTLVSSTRIILELEPVELFLEEVPRVNARPAGLRDDGPLAHCA